MADENFLSLPSLPCDVDSNIKDALNRLQNWGNSGAYSFRPEKIYMGPDDDDYLAINPTTGLPEFGGGTTLPTPVSLTFDPAQTMIVAKSGGDHTTIQAAIDAITDSSSTKPYTVLIFAGVYNEAVTITNKDYIKLQGLGGRDGVEVTHNTIPLTIGATSSGGAEHIWVDGIHFITTGSGALYTCCKLSLYGYSNTGDHIYFTNCKFTTSSAPYCFYIDGGPTAGSTLGFYNCHIECTTSGTTLAIRTLAGWGGPVSYDMIGCHIECSSGTGLANGLPGTINLVGNVFTNCAIDFSTGSTETVNLAGNVISTISIGASSTINQKDMQIRDASTSYYLKIESDSSTAHSADRTLTIDLDNADKTLRLGPGGGIVQIPTTDQSLANDAAIASNSSYVRVAGNGGAVVLDANPAIADGALDGQRILVQGTNDTNTVKIADACNTNMTGGQPFTLGLGDTIEFIWDSGDSLWHELTRSNA